MAFPRKMLHEREEIVLDLRPHWWFLFGPVATILLCAVVAVVVAIMVSGDVGQYALLAVAGVAVVAVVWLVGRYLRWSTTNFVLTTDRLIYRMGVVSKQGIEIPLERVNTVFSSQTVLERLLGTGDVKIESGGERGLQTFSDIRKPSWVQSEIYRQIEDNGIRMTGGRSQGPSVTEELERLDVLRQRGVLSEAEFHAQKAKLLERS